MTSIGSVRGARILSSSARDWVGLGLSHLAAGQDSEALLCFDAAIEQDDALRGLDAQRGVALFRLGRAQEAMTAYTAALTRSPDDADTWLNLGVLYEDSGYLAEALSCFETALLRRPDFVAAWTNRAKVQRALGDMGGAILSFDVAIQLSPNSAIMRFDRALCQLATGDYAQGWAGYDARFALNAEPKILPGRWPVWHGEPLSAKKLLVVGEQGLGDIFQFCRFVRELERRGADVTLRVPSALVPIMRGLVATATIVSEIGDEASFDFEVALMSLPLRLSPDSLAPPEPVRYLNADADRVALWRPRLDDGSSSVRIGIAWQGNPDYVEDHKRSIPLRAFGRIASVPNVRLISLQKYDGVEQLRDSEFAIERFGDWVDGDGAFVDTAAMLDCIDLVITSDTAVAHLAGALGRPVWLAIPRVPDWRWGLSGTTTAWYPTMRIFRQTEDDDWDGVLADIRLALEECFRA